MKTNTHCSLRLLWRSNMDIRMYELDPSGLWRWISATQVGAEVKSPSLIRGISITSPCLVIYSPFIPSNRWVSLQWHPPCWTWHPVHGVNRTLIGYQCFCHPSNCSESDANNMYGRRHPLQFESCYSFSGNDWKRITGKGRHTDVSYLQTGAARCSMLTRCFCTSA